MCMTLPGKVLEVRDHHVLVDIWGEHRLIRKRPGDPLLKPGNYILSHLDWVVGVIPPAEVEPTLELYQTIVAAVAPELLPKVPRREDEEHHSASSDRS